MPQNVSTKENYKFLIEAVRRTGVLGRRQTKKGVVSYFMRSAKKLAAKDILIEDVMAAHRKYTGRGISRAE